MAAGSLDRRYGSGSSRNPDCSRVRQKSSIHVLMANVQAPLMRATYGSRSGRTRRLAPPAIVRRACRDGRFKGSSCGRRSQSAGSTISKAGIPASGVGRSRCAIECIAAGRYDPEGDALGHGRVEPPAFAIRSPSTCQRGKRSPLRELEPTSASRPNLYRRGRGKQVRAGAVSGTCWLRA